MNNQESKELDDLESNSEDLEKDERSIIQKIKDVYCDAYSSEILIILSAIIQIGIIIYVFITEGSEFGTTFNEIMESLLNVLVFSSVVPLLIITMIRKIISFISEMSFGGVISGLGAFLLWFIKIIGSFILSGIAGGVMGILINLIMLFLPIIVISLIVSFVMSSTPMIIAISCVFVGFSIFDAIMKITYFKRLIKEKK